MHGHLHVKFYINLIYFTHMCSLRSCLSVIFLQSHSLLFNHCNRRRPRRRWVDNIRMDPQEVGCGYMDWIGRAQDRDRWRTLVSAVMNHRVP